MGTVKTPRSKGELLDWYRRYPWLFIEDVMEMRMWSGMKMVTESVFNNKRTSVRGCHGISKTTVAGAVAVAFLNLYENSVVVTTAPTHRQVAKLLWKEIRTLYQKFPGRLKGDCQTVDVKIEAGWYMIGFSTDQTTNIEGWHAQHILFIIDEAKGIPEDTYNALEGSMIGDCHMLEISTTDGADQQCPFRKHHSTERRNWKSFKFSVWDSPLVSVEDVPKEYKQSINNQLYDWGKPRTGSEWPAEAVADIPIADMDWILDRWQWKETNPYLWETKILGEFSDKGGNAVIPLSWAERARGADVKAIYTNGEIEYGLDVARMGDDRSVLFRRSGYQFEVVKVWGKTNTMETCGIVTNIVNAMPAQVLKVDANGVGAGVYDRLAELLLNGQLKLNTVYGIDSARKADNERKFFNRRAEMWWQARELFERNFKESGVMSIPDDDELIEDLTGMKYGTKSDGRLIVQPKDEFKKEFGRSPDKGDAFVYCLAQVQKEFVMEEWAE